MSTRLSTTSMVKTFAYPMEFKPRHCAGETCTHDHAGGSTPLPRVGQLRAGWLAKVLPGKPDRAKARKPWERAS